MIIKGSNKLNIIALATVLTVVIALLIYAAVNRAVLYKESVLNAEKKKLSIIARSNALRLEEYINTKRESLKVLALNPEVQQFFKQKTDTPLPQNKSPEIYRKQVYYILDKVQNISLTNSDGSYVNLQELCCPDHLSKVKRPEVKRCLELKAPHISNYFKTADGKGAITICEPVFANDIFLGVLSVLVYMDDINEFLSHVEYKSHGYAFICDKSGRVISHPNSKIVGLNIVAEQLNQSNDSKCFVLELVDGMTAGETGLAEYHLWDYQLEYPVKKMAAYHPVAFKDTGWSLGVSAGYAEFSDPINQFEGYTIAIVTGAILFLIIVFVYCIILSRAQYTQLFESQILLQRIIDHIPHRIFWKDVNLRFLGGNKEFMANSGFESIDKLRGLDEDSLPCTREQAAFNKECDEQVIRTGHDLCHYEETQTNIHGEEAWFDSSKIAMRNSKGEIVGVLGIYESITERKKVQEQLINLTENAERAYKVKSEFLANMSHEIRTPMNAIIGVSEFLLESDLNETQYNYASIIKKSSDLLLDIINSVLDYSKIEAGKLKLIDEKFELKASVEDTVKCFELNADSKNISLKCSVDSSVPRFVSGDHGKFRQVLVNLIGNALKFSENGVVEISVKLYECANDQFENSPSIEIVEGTVPLLISIRDNGVGISEDEQHKIFDAFVQADGSASRTHGGTGLGLSISSELVKMMNGDIWLDSKEGEGSVFSFVIQVEPVEDVPEVKGEEEQPAVCNEQLDILIVDDDPMNQMVVSTMLNKVNFNTQVAENGHEAILLFRENAYDIILMDLMMPVLNGFEATKSIRSIEKENNMKHTPIIAFSACAAGTDVDKCNEAGCDGYLSKPVRRVDLIAKINDYVKINK